MSSLTDAKQRPALYSENGHGHALRDGNDFYMDFHIAGLAASGISNVRFVTGAKAIVFESADFTINQEDVLFEVFEDTVYSAPGVLNTGYVFAMNRIVNRATQIQFYDGATITDDGNDFMHTHITGAAGQNTNRPGFGSSARSNSRVLKPNTEHLFRITNNSALPVDIEAQIFYREVDPREYE